MKTDNKFRMRMMAAAVIGLAFVSGMTQCKKKIVAVEPQPSDDMIEVTVSAGTGGTKTLISGSGEVTWKKGDKIYIVGETQGLLGYVSASSSGDAVAFRGKITALTSDQVLRFYYVGNRTLAIDDAGNCTFDFSSQDGTLDGISRNNQVMGGVSGDVVSTDDTNFGHVDMFNAMSIAKFDISGYNSPAQCEAIMKGSMNLKTGEIIDEGSYGVITLNKTSSAYYMVLVPADEEQTLTFRQDESDDDPVVKSKLVQPGRLYTQSDGSSIEVKTVPTALSGVFTVGSGEADKVTFSRGNLYWDGSDGKFKMEDRQWKPMQYINLINPANLKFFYWSDNAEVARAIEYNDPSASASNVLFTNAADISPNPYFEVEGEDGWRTLSNTEWQYLLNSRTGNRFAKAMLHESCGLLIFPDGYEVTGGTGISAINSSNADFPSQSIPSDIWAVMESDGVAFLPASGYRSDDVQYYVGTDGYYWSSSNDGFEKAYGMYFDSDRTVTNSSVWRRYDGYSIRLVRNLSGGGATGNVESFEGATWGE